MEQALPGQRWVSDSEPELGLGVVMKAEFGRVEIYFPAANEHRQYAIKTAPLRRVRFQEGDTIKTHEGQSLEVESVEERKGMLFYLGASRQVSEAELSDTISFSKPEDRLLAGQVDEPRDFDLRVEALKRRAALRRSTVRGFCGGRVDLLPHQMYIASEVSSRLVPRVLLADEVGLGKTIEASLILHRLHLTGRAERVLILVPEPLVNQWFVELFRRFHLLFAIFDEMRCDSIETNEENGNPFLDSQLVLCSTAFLAGSPERARQAAEAGWDLLIVDEAHHLEWTPERASPAYTLVQSLAEKTPGLLLLTATPQQLGPEGHFARLRLLDPSRYADLGQFLEETLHYEEVARALDRLLAGKSPTAADSALFIKKSPHLQEHLDAMKAGTEGAREKLVSSLLDEFGTGRVMFRNSRAALSGFPQRSAKIIPLEAADDPLDAKVKWLAGLLKKLGGDKVLLICRSRDLAVEIHEKLLHEVNLNAAVFHEGLTLLQRDRQAAWFAEEEGARVLISSEIGSEGRNFQFAHHLVLFDLPDDPELLEQRIGRLDRIGQSSTIHIHAPCIQGGPEEVLARWYHEGLHALEANLHGATEILHALRPELDALLAAPEPERLEAFIHQSSELRKTVAKKLERGHDRLLELNSCKPEKAAQVIDDIRAQDRDTEFEEFFIRLVDHFGMHVEELGNRSYFLLPGNLTTDAFPALPDDGLTVTFDRARALSRENTGFLTPDHPMVRGALDLLLGAEGGNSSFGLWRGSGSEGLMLETHFVVECIAPPELHVDRFLSPGPLRVVVDHAKKDRRDDAAFMHARIEKGSPSRLFENPSIKRKIFPAMLSKSRKIAKAEMEALVEAAVSSMRAQLQAEIERLEDLAQINDHVRPEEIEAMRSHMALLEKALGSARLRLDALRLVLRMS
ncbi:MAG TPA: RNA polymerase-binding ATPase [Verrucomicrobiales bacterium]|nr:RNA polymerase-binding ATPase [Verrucomicrobiales bacterium]